MIDEPDDYLIERVREALAHHPSLGELDVHVSIRGGRLLLTGVVATAERHVLVGEVASRVAGDHEVCNETTVSTLQEDSEPERLS